MCANVPIRFVHFYEVVYTIDSNFVILSRLLIANCCVRSLQGSVPCFPNYAYLYFHSSGVCDREISFNVVVDDHSMRDA